DFLKQLLRQRRIEHHQHFDLTPSGRRARAHQLDDLGALVVGHLLDGVEVVVLALGLHAAHETFECWSVGHARNLPSGALDRMIEEESPALWAGAKRLVLVLLLLPLLLLLLLLLLHRFFGAFVNLDLFGLIVRRRYAAGE